MDCHSPAAVEPEPISGEVVALVGQPNVGKSVLFHRLTGRRVAVGNYPGTTVEVATAAASFQPGWRVLDTPGVLTFPSRTEDEQVAAAALLDPDLRTVVHVGDGKHLRRTLQLTLQLAETGLPMVLALNMADENESWGVDLDAERLAATLGIPVVATAATNGEGLATLAERIRDCSPAQGRVRYPRAVEDAVADLAPVLPPARVRARSLALLFLAGDPVVERWLAGPLGASALAAAIDRRARLTAELGAPVPSVLRAARAAAADRILAAAAPSGAARRPRLRIRLGRAAMHPVLGLPIMVAALAAMFWFVGVFGAGVLVDLLETQLFAEAVNPTVIDWVERLVPFDVARDLLVGPYGLWTMGMTYALALILPIVTTFFLAFGILEDSGYLPRVAVLTNRVFRSMGLNGRAVIPMVLGLGCVTMATLTTRTLDGKRDRILVTFLLALAIPCSAQLGVVVGLLAGVSAAAVAIWSLVVLAVLVGVGWLAARLIPGARTPLVTEMPPLRTPRLGGVAARTVARLEWYLAEVIPLFLVGSLIVFALDLSGILGAIIDWSEPVVAGWLGLPAATATAFVMGFLRRDFGAAGLFAMAAAGLLTAPQLLVAMITLTLFVPCIASVLMISRERGAAAAAAIVGVAMPLAFAVGGVTARVLEAVGWTG